jgi:hypothetical protein
MSDENKQKELLEWYYSGDVGGYDVVVSNMARRGSGLGPKDGSGPYRGPGGQGIRRDMHRVADTERSDLESPSSADMSSVPPNSPQSDIQREIERKDREQEQPTTADEVAYEDKKKIYRAYGMLEVLEDKMKQLYAMTNAYQNEPQKREQLAMDIKQISRDLADMVGEL